MLDILRKRRSIRRFKDKEIEKELIEQLMEAALRSPTSRGINPWRFLFVTDRALLEELSQAKESGSSFLKGARLGVVIIAMEGESDVWVEDCSIASIILQLTGQSLGLGAPAGSRSLEGNSMKRIKDMGNYPEFPDSSRGKSLWHFAGYCRE